jgi:hypothetical protein
MPKKLLGRFKLLFFKNFLKIYLETQKKQFIILILFSVGAAIKFFLLKTYLLLFIISSVALDIELPSTL